MSDLNPAPESSPMESSMFRDHLDTAIMMFEIEDYGMAIEELRSAIDLCKSNQADEKEAVKEATAKKQLTIDI